MACQPEPLLLGLAAQCECVRTSSLQGELNWSQESCTKNNSSPSLGFFQGELSADARRRGSHCGWQQSFKRFRPACSVLPCSRTNQTIQCFLPHDIALQGELSLRRSMISAYRCRENFRNLRGIYVTDKILFSWYCKQCGKWVLRHPHAVTTTKLLLLLPQQCICPFCFATDLIAEASNLLNIPNCLLWQSG